MEQLQLKVGRIGIDDVSPPPRERLRQLAEVLGHETEEISDVCITEAVAHEQQRSSEHVRPELEVHRALQPHAPLVIRLGQHHRLRTVEVTMELNNLCLGQMLTQ